jgi:hypothetical protein
MRWAVVEKQNPTVELVAAGASADVVGPDEDMISPAATAEVIKCKPFSQLGTWLDGYCRAAVPGAAFPDPMVSIRSAPFAE